MVDQVLEMGNSEDSEEVFRGGILPAQYTEYLKCDFSDAEIADRAKELATANRRRTSIEQQKKEIDSDLKSQIEAENSKIQRLSEQIGMGYEYRNVECSVEIDTPSIDRKRIVRLDTGEEVKVVSMTAEDKQASLDLQILSYPAPLDIHKVPTQAKT